MVNILPPEGTYKKRALRLSDWIGEKQNARAGAEPLSGVRWMKAKPVFHAGRIIGLSPFSSSGSRLFFYCGFVFTLPGFTFWYTETPKRAENTELL
jgi:hypothetical protein